MVMKEHLSPSPYAHTMLSERLKCIWQLCLLLVSVHERYYTETDFEEHAWGAERILCEI